MKKIPPKKAKDKKEESTSILPEKKKDGRGKSPAFLANQQKAKLGLLNPKGRTKGSRNRFAEAFVNDFLNDWEQHGSETIGRVREEDPSTYVRVGVSIIPKDFNINSQNEANLDKLLDQFDDDELQQFIDGVRELGAIRRAEENKEKS